MTKLRELIVGCRSSKY